MAVQKSAPIEGMVFIGDIPIPMIRDAQHMASAFKIDQTLKRMEQTACPSDRFYDDLNLEFNFIKQDEKKPLLFYYSLSHESPQMAAPSLYSGRIKSFAKGDKSEYDRLRSYLKKVVRVKAQNDTLNQFMFFAGQGYNSESMISRIDEKEGYFEYFPWLKRQASSIVFKDHQMAKFSKYDLMSQLQRKDLALAVLHHHGSVTDELINRYPNARNANDNLEAAKSFFRSKIRTAVERGGDKDSVCMRYATEYNVPVQWFDSIFTKLSIEADSIFNDQLDLHIYDLGKYKPNARVVVLDACFNGAFNNKEYISGEYIFEDGDCVVTIANSVNSLQDKWFDRNIGLLGYGMHVGNFVKYNPYLESHVIGDPTFSFAPAVKLPFDINEALHKDASFWKKQLSSPYAAMQLMAMERLTAYEKISTKELLKKFKTSSDNIVRFGALMMLSHLKGDDFVEAVSLGLNDNSEIVQRFSSIYAGKIGDPRLVPALTAALNRNSNGKRVDFQLRSAMALFPYDALMAELKKQDPYKYAYDPDSSMQKAIKMIDGFSDKRYTDDLVLLTEKNPSKRDLKLFIKGLRNNPVHTAVPQLLTYLETTDNEEMQYYLVDAFGWFNYSYRAAEIAEELKKVVDNPKYSERVRNEAKKSIIRLTQQSESII